MWEVVRLLVLAVPTGAKTCRGERASLLLLKHENKGYALRILYNNSHTNYCQTGKEVGIEKIYIEKNPGTEHNRSFICVSH
jgi:hypothetical protein